MKKLTNALLGLAQAHPNKKFLKFYNFINFMVGFIVDLKTFLGLAMLNQSFLGVTK